jgi:hypothetical protein
MGEVNNGTHGAGSDRDDDRRERYYLKDSAGIGGMPRFQAPTRSNQNVKPSEEDTSPFTLTRNDAAYISESLAELERLKEQIVMMRQTQRQAEELMNSVAEIKRETKARWTGTTPATIADPYRTPQKQTNERAVMQRGSPVEEREYKENPEFYARTGLYETGGNPKWGMPKNKDTKLTLAKFSGKETYKGLGTGINEWTSRFMRQL